MASSPAPSDDREQQRPPKRQRSPAAPSDNDENDKDNDKDNDNDQVVEVEIVPVRPPSPDIIDLELDPYPSPKPVIVSHRRVPRRDPSSPTRPFRRRRRRRDDDDDKDDISSGPQDITYATTFHCPICLSTCPISQIFRASSCAHALCESCAVSMLRVVALDTKKLPVMCPSCPSELHSYGCQRLLTRLASEDVASAFERLVLELEVISNLVYCSNSSCNTPFDWEPPPSTSNDVAFRVLCPLCRVETCARCRTQWHANESCAAYKQRLDSDDAFRVLAGKKHWTPCPQCGQVVEKVAGCNHVRCKCGTSFCHKCGLAYVSKSKIPDAPNANVHGTPACRCNLY